MYLGKSSSKIVYYQNFSREADLERVQSYRKYNLYRKIIQPKGKDKNEKEISIRTFF